MQNHNEYNYLFIDKKTYISKIWNNKHMIHVMKYIYWVLYVEQILMYDTVIKVVLGIEYIPLLFIIKDS